MKKFFVLLSTFFILTALFVNLSNLSIANAQSGACRLVYYNEGEPVPDINNQNIFDTVEACIANAGEFGCYYRDSSGTCAPKSPTDCQYIRAGGGVTFDSAGACALNEAPGNYCYIRNTNGTCTRKDPTYCTEYDIAGGTSYDSETECVNQGQSGACYYKSNNICTALNTEQCRAYRNNEGDPFESLEACLQSSVNNTKPLACASETDCPGDDSVCNTTTFRCEAKSTAVANGTSCNNTIAYTPTGTGTTGAICCVGGATECATNYSCIGSGNNTFGSCQPSSTGTGTGGTSPNQSSATGTGSCAACLGLGGQAERDCYAQCSGTIQTGICAGMTAAQCQQACSQTPGATTQICSGAQEGAGTPRAGEFLACGASSTNGCGQVDCINSSGTLIGFVIDTASCTTPDNQTPSTPTTTTNPSTKPKPSPTLNPDLAACGEACVSDNNCADANHSCHEGVCRLTSNPTNTECKEPTGTTPSPTPQVSPTPVPSPDPDLAKCNESCSKHSDCADLLHSCQGGVCRLTSNPTNAECKTPTNTTPPTVPRTPSTPLQCNDPCTSNSQCTSFNHVCHNGTCRLSTNLDNVSCTAAVVYQSSSTQLGQISQQPDSPTALPSAGAQDFGAWIMTGIGALAVGAVILLLL